MFSKLRKIFLRRNTPSEIEIHMGYIFKDKDLLKIALTHRSMVDENHRSYERLEFLGDSILDLIVSEYLYLKLPKESEGSLTLHRTVLVNADYLLEVAAKLMLNKYCIVEKGINLNNPSTSKKLLSSVVESLIGAIYLDSGLKSAEHFVNRWIIKSAQRKELISDFNHKGRLFEICQKKKMSLPDFRIQNVVGPEHQKYYKISVFIGNQKFGTGSGKTKREAEQEAARQTIENNSQFNIN